MIIKELEEIIKDRIENASPERSYVAQLKEKGVEKILKKIFEEGLELALATKENDRKAIIYEASDLIFHIMVLLGVEGVKIEDIFKELERRFGKSGIEEKKERLLKPIETKKK